MCGDITVSLLGDAFDEVAAYFGKLLSLAAGRGGCGTIEPLLRLFQTFERDDCNSPRRRSFPGCDLSTKNDVLPAK